MAIKDGIGKWVGSARYLHKDTLSHLSVEDMDPINRAVECVTNPLWNVVKIEKKSVSLLLYESFDDHAFPALLHSTKVDLGSKKATSTDYRSRTNPPILHRKELLLVPDDPRLPTYRALTAVAEEHGLFREHTKIGTRKAWESRISEAGLILRGHRLLPANEDHVEVARHRTAIVRRDLSQPMQLMMRFGVVEKGRSIFDYGCGQGEDVAALASQGFEAFGWDPHHAPGGQRGPADVVNLGYVLNVIEDPHERIETLRAAWGFARHSLCVSVMVQGKTSTAGQRPFRDGYLTSRGTFQKYYEQIELQSLVADVTGQKPLAFSPGIVAVFRDKELEQEVLLRRRSRAFVQGALPRPPQRERVVAPHSVIRESIGPAIETLRNYAMLLGRLPEQIEVPADTLAILTQNRVSWQRVAHMLRVELHTDDTFVAAARLRREDLLVHLALMQFPGAPKYSHLPRSIQADLRAFFRGHSAAMDEGRRLLFAAGDRQGVRADVEAAIIDGLGAIRGSHHFRFHSTVLSRLPSRLRVLVGSAEVLQGGVESSDLVEIDLDAPRIIMIVCDDFERPVPFVVERTIIDLGRLKVATDRREVETMPVYFKSRFMLADDPARDAQLAFETSLLETGLFDTDKRVPEWSDVQACLSKLTN